MKKYIKKSLILFSVFTFFLFNFGGIVLAQTMASPDIAPIPPIPSDNSNSLLFGQKHSYSAVFRANGEAITYAKLVIPNREEKALSEFSFEIPKVDISEIIMYQMKLPKECVRYDYATPSNPCLEYRDPDYGQDYYYYGNSQQQAEYTKIKYTKTDNTYKLTLPNAVEPNKSTALIISYATKGYVNQNFGLYKFNFETIKVNSRIQSIKVAVDVDSDLLLKGKRASVNYNEVSNIPMAKLGDSSAVSSRELDSLVSNIGVSGSIIKEGKSLAPNETFNVKGEYAKTWLRLYLTEIIITILVVIVIIILIYLISKYINSKSKNISNSIDVNTNSMQINTKSINLFNISYVLVGLGSVISVLIVNYIFGLLGLSSFWQDIIYNPNLSNIIIIITILLYTLIILAPAIIISLRKGWGSLLSIIILQFIWFAIILAVYLILFQTSMTEMMPMPRPMPYY
jgi:hypothetical protein